jgi:ribose transport system permease protein
MKFFPRRNGREATYPQRPSLNILRRFTSLAVMLVLIVFFSIAAPGFTSPLSIVNILGAASLFLPLALGETLVMVSGGIDLSVGSMEALGAVVAATYMTAHPSHNGVAPVIVGILLGVGVGAVGGVVNGVLISLLKLNPLIVTLGSYGAFLGFANLISGGVPVGNLPALAFTLGNGSFLGVPFTLIVVLVIVFILFWVLRNTKFGRYTYAIGSNREAARRGGVGLTRHTIMLYGTAGLLAGFAGVMGALHFESASSSQGSTDLLVAIAAVVIGGTPLTGGEGSVWGTVIGALVYTILQNGFVLMGVSSYWQLVTVGAIIIIAVYGDEFQRGLQSRLGSKRELEIIAPKPLD